MAELLLVEPSGPELPRGHGVPKQAPAPVVLVKVPDKHRLHAFAMMPVEPRAPNWPMGHGKPLQLVERAEKAHMPDGHGKHVASTALVLPVEPKVPAAQPATPGVPNTATKHAVEAVVFEKRPGAQGVQTAELNELAPGEPKVPAMQADPAQVPRPVEEVNVPGVHNEHVASSGFVEPSGPDLPSRTACPSTPWTQASLTTSRRGTGGTLGSRSQLRRRFQRGKQCQCNLSIQQLTSGQARMACKRWRPRQQRSQHCTACTWLRRSRRRHFFRRYRGCRAFLCTRHCQC